MKKKVKNHHKKVAKLLIIVLFAPTLFYFFSSKEVEFEDVSFKEFLKNHSLTTIPYEVHFSIINKKFEPVNCTLIFSSIQSGKLNETNYALGIIQKRTKLKYKIPFNMSIGNTSINLINNCTII